MHRSRMEISKKHAFLIICHTDFELLKQLIHQIDDYRNDIFMHVDKKATDFDVVFFSSLPKKSKIRILQEIDVMWGDYSQIQTELLLFEHAFNENYSYYHLISGADLMLKSSDELHMYFGQREDVEFMDCTNLSNISQEHREDRFSYYYFNWLNHRKGFRRIHKILLDLQKKIGINRYKNTYEVFYGSNWVSITGKAVQCLLSHKLIIRQRYRFSYCCDEFYKQTILMEHNFNLCDQNEQGNMRYIVWPKDGNGYNPKTLKEEDYQNIISSNSFFARKFSTNVDRIVIDKIVSYVNSKEK